jgi:alkanesulfonate monooxygenase SsuD/methylene tetrahydromethanopterin reductase-like flavin-dependent oxidoreductase (luciferase family)
MEAPLNSLLVKQKGWRASALSNAGEDLIPMKFGLFYEWPNPALRNWKTLFEEGMEQIQYSEEVGFDYCLIAEHHFSNYGNSPAPLLQALYIGQRTRRIKIATGILVLPIWQPLRLAEEVAVLDNLIDGRFICGVGRGYQPHEMGRFGISLEESRQRFNETLEVLIKAWTQDESFTYDGDHIQIPDEVTVWPKPMQKPHPPFWVAGTSVETMKLAAQWDMMPITTGLLGAQGMRAHLGALVHARLDLGKPIHPLELGMQAITHVAGTDKEARAQLGYARWQNRAGRALNRLEVADGRVQVGPYSGELDDDGFMERLFFGSPDTVIDKFKRAAELGVTHVSNWMMFGGIEHEKIMRSIRLMGEEVIPALKDVHPPASLAEELAEAPPVTTDQLQAARFGPAPSDVTTT